MRSQASRLGLFVGVYLVGTPLLFAQPVKPTLSVPATLSVPQPGLVILTAQTNCSWVGWHAIDPGIQLIPAELLKNSMTCVGFAGSTGTFHILAYAGNDTAAAPEQVCTVTVGSPTPPPPPPPPPTPADPLTATIQTAYLSDTLQGKAAKKDLLQALYQQASTVAVNSTTLVTVGDLFNALSAARKSLIADTELVAERQAVATYLSGKLPTTATAPLDPATRALCGKEFATVAAALGGVR
jgi:hypothetical protein